MKVSVFKPDVKELDNLRQQLVSFQDELNRTLSKAGYGQATRINITFRTAELPKIIPHGLTSPPWGLVPVYLRNLTDDTTYPSSGFYVDWIPDSGGITLRHINGLVSGNLYELRMIAYA